MRKLRLSAAALLGMMVALAGCGSSIPDTFSYTYFDQAEVGYAAEYAAATNSGVYETSFEEIADDEALMSQDMESEDGGEYTLSFPDSGSVAYAHTMGEDEDVSYILEIIKTNTCQLSIVNQGDAAFMCNLYYPDDITLPIQSTIVEAGDTAYFENLSASETYCIGFQADVGVTVSASLSG